MPPPPPRPPWPKSISITSQPKRLSPPPPRHRPPTCSHFNHTLSSLKTEPKPRLPQSSLLPAHLRLNRVLSDLTPTLASPAFAPSDRVRLLELIEHALGLLVASRPLRIALCGNQATGRPADVLDCLLRDPLQARSHQIDALLRARPRPQADGELLVIHHVAAPAPDPRALAVPSAWLATHDLAIYELATCPTRLPGLDAPLPPCDATVLVLDPAREAHLLDSLPHSPLPLLVLLNSPHPVPLAELSNTSAPVINVDSKSALAALDRLSSEPGPSPAAYAQLQASNLPALQSALVRALEAPGAPSTAGPLTPVQLRTALCHARLLLTHISGLLERRKEALVAAQMRLDELGLEFEALAQAMHAALELDKDSRPVQRALARLWTGELAWWKLALRSDDVGERVLRTLIQTELVRIEQRLVFQAGYLAAVAAQPASLIRALLGDALLRPVLTQTLSNEVLQARPPELVYPHALLGPLIRRRDQLVSPGGPLDVLQRRARIQVAKCGGAVAGGAVMGVATHAGYITSTLAGVGPDTGFLVGVAVCVGTIWNGQRKWKEAQRAFGEDWSRWRESLSVDLQKQKERIVDEYVYKQWKVARDGILKVMGNEKQGLEVLKKDVGSFVEEVEEVRKEAGRGLD